MAQQLIPTFQAAELRDALSEYITTTFGLTDHEASRALEAFLSDPTTGMFKGPFVKLRRPFKPAADGWREALDWFEGYPPYRHQAKAFQRLSSKNQRPQPTLITTGTGSGKTESFLVPILDHARRERALGRKGVKALILYPMNALANDQAKRITEFLTQYPELKSVTAAIYTGERGEERAFVTAKGLITRRETIQQEPPDILLTNYKMLDQMLLRPNDQKIWSDSALSLQYLVLDEFHTYDGAQGTDVAMLLRRLGLALKSHWSAEAPVAESDWQRPLGIITPVATSATLGSGGDPSAMLNFAHTVFGEHLDESALVSEERATFEEWAVDAEPAAGLDAVPGLTGSDIREALKIADAGAALARSRGESGHRERYVAVLDALFNQVGESGIGPTSAHELSLLNALLDDPFAMLRALKASPVVRRAVELAGEAIDAFALGLELVADLDETMILTDEERDTVTRFTADVVALLSYVRSKCGLRALNVEAHLWVRELSRLDRLVSVAQEFRWTDESEMEREGLYLPAIYCRHCGRSGWAAKLAATGNDLDRDDSTIRTARFDQDSRFRPVMFAQSEQDAILPLVARGERAIPEELQWFDWRNRTFLTKPPGENDQEFLDGDILPVLTLTGASADKDSKRDLCPVCQTADGVRFLGAAVSTLLSVALSTLFGNEHLEIGEKKALVFTDSVQDAAHRAGFIQARSHTMTMRSAWQSALQRLSDRGEAMTLETMARETVNFATTAILKYQLIAPDYSDKPQFAPFWHADSSVSLRREATHRVRERVLFDALLEFGVQSRVGRTLELTGSVVAEIDAGDAVNLIEIADQAIALGDLQLAIDSFEPSDENKVQWVRGALERLRGRGGIDHLWFKKFLESDGSRWFLWGGREKRRGMPAFPPGRSAPAFVREGGTTQHDTLDPLSVRGGWYPAWAAKALNTDAATGRRMARQLFVALANHNVVTQHVSSTGAHIYAISPQRVQLQLVDDIALKEGAHFVACSVCSTPTPGTTGVIEQLDGAPCLSMKCPGVLGRQSRGSNFYRGLYSSTERKRIVSREHTSLLPDELRLKYESEFKSPGEKAGAPNVLVATPTLEMGIDIGDLSSVMLASMPPRVANYVQRVGRAGRRTGNALVLAYVRGRGDSLTKLHDPLSVINGAVDAPATFLGASEILRRQYLAFVIDDMARAGMASTSFKAYEVLDPNRGEGTLLTVMIKHQIAHHARLLALFLGSYGTLLGPESQALLREWATPVGPANMCELIDQVHAASQLWGTDLHEMRRITAALEARLPDLDAAAAAPVATDGDLRAPRQARAQIAATQKAISAFRNEYWVGALEFYGLLPNYTLLDDAVELEVLTEHRDIETNQYRHDQIVVKRGISSALTEMVPGAHFYVQGLDIKIDGVDLGPDASKILRWQICPDCGWSNDMAAMERVGRCANCASEGIADVSQDFDVIELKRVSASVNVDDATISDNADERRRESFAIASTYVSSEGQDSAPWVLAEYGLSVEYMSKLQLRWYNLGRRGNSGREAMIAGQTQKAAQFRLCSYCGVLDSTPDENRPDEHRIWCPHRKAAKESTREVIFARTLTTEGVILEVPYHVVAGDILALPTLKAAIRLGLQKLLGGAPQHLQAQSCQWVQAGETRAALWLFDAVPGGTGYLAEFKRYETVRNLIIKAYEAVRDCDCISTEQLACHRCLLPHADAREVHQVTTVTALRLLTNLLSQGEVDTYTPDFDPHAWEWKMEQRLVQKHERLQQESMLEGRFREALLQHLVESGATVKPVSMPQGTRYDFSFNGSPHQWTMTPQQNMATSKPDFVIESRNPNIPALCVFTDGRFFHATGKHNRVADDAEKRAELRAQGYIPWAVTWSDIASFTAKNVLPVPAPWFSKAKQKAEMVSTPHKQDQVNRVNQNAMTQLVNWLKNPNVDDYRTFSEVLPWLLAGVPQLGKFSAFDQHVRGLAMGDYQDLPVAKDVLVVYSEPGLVLALGADRSLGARAREVNVAYVVLEDSAAFLDTDAGEAAWQRWLHVSNLLAFRSKGEVRAVTTSMLGAAAVNAEGEVDPFDSLFGTALDAASAMPTPPASGFAADLVQSVVEATIAVESSAAWQAAIDTTMEGVERAMAQALARVGNLPVPEVGVETDDWQVLSFVWADLGIAVCLNPDETLTTPANLRIFDNDVEAVIAALKEKI